MARTTKTRLIFGAMTGTSIDAIDIAAVRVAGRGLNIRSTLIGQSSAPLGELTRRLRDAQRQLPLTVGELATMSRDLALAHLPPLRELARSHGNPDLVAVHGQTLYHQPPVSLQLIDPTVIAQEMGCDVVCNLRGADLAAGGQGAPITPLSDWIMFRTRNAWRAVVNLGGFSNATILPASPAHGPRAANGKPANSVAANREEWIAQVRGFDLCLCNQLLDHLARSMAGIPFDDGGRLALAGRINPTAVEAVRILLDQQRLSGRSLGTSDEIVEQSMAHLSQLTPPDALATACEAIAMTIARALDAQRGDEGDRRPMRVLVAGGGVRNAGLMNALRGAISGSLATTDQYGIPVDARESIAMALLGALASDGVSITLPRVTGRGSIRSVDGAFLRAFLANGERFTNSSHNSTAEGLFVHP